jgi:hypothetical protein
VLEFNAPAGHCVGGVSWIKSIGAVLAGFLVVGILHTATDLILEKMGIFPPPDQPAALGTRYLAVAAIYRNIYNVFGGWLTARLAPNRPVGHAIVLGVLGLFANIAGGIVMWKIGAHWYPFLLAALALPSCWLGGILTQRGRDNVKREK